MQFWNHRVLCDVLEEMRTCHKTRNFSPLMGLIEEAQGMGNRMEAAISMEKDMAKIGDEFAAKKAELKSLMAKIKKAEDKLPAIKKAKKVKRAKTAKAAGKAMEKYVKESTPL